MQNKGFIRFIAICLVLVCLFYLSFSYVSKGIESDASKYAAEQAALTGKDSTSIRTAYIDSIAKETVYLGYTYQKVREKEVGLGLDLKGGMNVTLQISVPDILKALANNNQDPVFNQAINNAVKNQANNDDFVDGFYEEYKKLKSADEINLYIIFKDKIGSKLDAKDRNNAKVLEVLKAEVNSQVDNSFNVLRTRIDRFGVVAPNIQKLEKSGRISLELPGIKEPERVRKLLQGSANLEFFETYTLDKVQANLSQLANAYMTGAKPAKVVADSTSVATDSTAMAVVDSVAAPKADVKAATPSSKDLAQLLNWGTKKGAGYIGGPVIGVVAAKDTAEVNVILNSDQARASMPNDFVARWSVKPIEITDAKGNKKETSDYQLIALKTTAGKPALAGDVVTDASDNYENLRGYEVSMEMNRTGATKWAKITGAHKGECIAIVLDNQVYSYPRVNDAIEGGRSSITGNFTAEEAKDLANVLKSGKMVAQVSIVEESVIGPSLGQEAIDSGMSSFVIALVLLMIFMMCIYGVGPGLIANLGLIFNLFFTMGILAAFGAVLTLSGIAGIVLALGMAVDANVLIFERSKEELRNGKNVKQAVSDGYKNAFSAIFDSNLTSIITGIILLIYGTGPIKGFATTLIIGIVCSFFTAVFLTRLVMESCIEKGWFKNLTFNTSLTKHMFENARVNFLGQRKVSFTIALVMVVIVAGSFALRGLNQGIDFSGGRNYVVKFEKPISTENVRRMIVKEFPEHSGVSVIAIGGNDQVRISTNYLIENNNNDSVESVVRGMIWNAVKNEFSKTNETQFEVVDEDSPYGIASSQKVGPSIAEDITRGAVWAVVLSLIAMALYILIRFRNISFSIGTLVSVVFTSFIIIGFYSLFWGILPFSMEIDQTFIAAILTVIGYSVNDTVVVFDRVREVTALYPKRDRADVINGALNSTLGRTLMTSLSTVLVLLCVFILGGDSIRSFTFAMLFGVIIGTLSTIYVATPTAYYIQRKMLAKEAAKLNQAN